MERYFAGWAEECGISHRHAHGARPLPGRGPRRAVQHGGDGPAPGRPSPTACPSLHGQTSREMFQALWPTCPPRRRPIGSVTNGVHGRTWVSSEMDDLLSKYVSPGVGRGRAGRLGPHRRRPRRRAVAGPGAGPRRPGQLRPGAPAQVPAGPGRVASATRRGPTRCSTRAVLIVGFARRFATYKRATLLLSQPDRLRALLLDRAPAGAAGVRRQGPPGRRPRQGDDPPDRAVLPRPGGAPPHRLRRGLRHLRGPHAVPGQRRVAEHAPPAHGGVRHERREGRAQRRAQLLDPRRLVGRDVRRQQRLGHLLGRVASPTSTTATRSRPTASSSSSSARSSRCSTTGAAGGSPAAG